MPSIVLSAFHVLSHEMLIWHQEVAPAVLTHIFTGEDFLQG